MLRIEEREEEGTFDSEETVDNEWKSTTIGGILADAGVEKREFLLEYFELVEKTNPEA